MKNSIILKWNENISENQKSKLISQYNLINIKSSRLYEIYGIDNPLFISQLIYESGLVKYCYPEFISKVEKHNYYIPNDEFFGNQFYLHNTGQQLNDGHFGTNDADIDAPEAWNITKGSSNVVIAVVDEGVTDNHPDLPSSRQIRLAGSNFNLDDGLSDNDPSPHNNGNHGNAVAGIVGAEMDNNEGIVGITPLSKIMPVKIPFGNYPAQTYADAITFAADNNADIISNSWGFNSSDPNLFPVIIDAIQDAINQGSVVLFSAGNKANHVSNNQGFVTFPANANVPLLITVGASDRNDQQANYSPTSPLINITAPSHTAYNNQISGEAYNVWTMDIPGTAGYNTWNYIFSTLPSVGEMLPSSGTNHLSYTGRMGGTSASAPIVAGIVGLIKSVNPCLSVQQIIDIIYQTADKVGPYDYNWNPDKPGHSKELGYGRVNAHKAVQLAQELNSPTLDLFVKDSPDEMGVEPNTVTEYMWTSKDIWIRNTNDNGLEHQNPEYKSDGSPNYIYVRVINKSCVASNGNETLTINWAKANTALNWPEYWDGTLNDSDGDPLGGELPFIATLPVIQSGQEVIIEIPWVVPNPEDYSDNDNPHHFCLLSRIDAADDPLTSPMTANPNIMVRNNNNLAWKNLTVVDLETETTASVFVSNISNSQRAYLLELQKETNEQGKAIYDEAEVTLKMDDVLYDAWERGGKQAQLLDPTNEEKRKLVKGNNVILDNILFDPNEIGLLTLEFNFLTEEITNKAEFVYHVIQKDATTGEIIGGETFLIHKKQRPVFVADAGDNKEVDLNESITITAEDINEIAEYNWYDLEGNLIYTGKDLTVSVDVTKKYKLEIIAEDGFKDYDEIEVKLKPSIIESISPNPTSNEIQVNYKLNGVNSAYLMIIGQYGGVSNNYVLNITSNQTAINLSSYSQGFYTIALVCDGQIVDAKTLMKQ